MGATAVTAILPMEQRTCTSLIEIMTIDLSLEYYLISLNIWPDIRNNVRKALAWSWGR